MLAYLWKRKPPLNLENHRDPESMSGLQNPDRIRLVGGVQSASALVICPIAIAYSMGQIIQETHQEMR